MAVKYDLYKTPRPTAEPDAGYHVRAMHMETVTTHEIARRIEHDTALTEGDVKNVLVSLSHYLVDCLQNGKRMHIEGTGYFSLAIEAPTVASPHDMRAERIRVKGINYRPDKQVKTKLASTKFEREKEKSHSETLSDEEVRLRITDYFTDHAYMRRKDFERLCGFTRTTAIRRLNTLLDEGFLIRDGVRAEAVYIKN